MFENLFQQPSYSKAKASDKYNPLKRSQDVLTVESNVSITRVSFLGYFT